MAKKKSSRKTTAKQTVRAVQGEFDIDGVVEAATADAGDADDVGGGTDASPDAEAGATRRDEGGVTHVNEMFEDWFIDYASYVILERAVPHVDDGLKPVQRRILHSLKEKDTGSFNKVANIVGHTMQYHPHGDASIGDALVQLGQKNLLVETQGNWGNILTGDGAAAPRYIEARLSKFALDVAFNPKTTRWAKSYDGQNSEPVTLPMKFPLLLAQGAEGIAVGLACKILPHNFLELIDGCIAALRKEPFEVFPDFPTGGILDVTEYQNGLRGGRIRVRARIDTTSTKRIIRITEIPFGTTTGGLMDNIVAANDKGKIKIARIEDNTAEKVEILVHLPQGIEPEQAIEALYAFTDCELSISPNACVIEDNKPRFLGVDELLRRAAFRTRDLLRWELEIRLGELEDKWHFSSLERIFIENRIYRRIEESTTWESVIGEIWIGLKPFLKQLRRAVTDDDVVRLTEIKIKRISKFDSSKADEQIRGIEEAIGETRRMLAGVTKYTIRYFREIREKHGKGRERRTEIASFEKVVARQVAVANETLYLNAKDGFAGWGLKRGDGVVLDKCSRMDDIIAFGNDGTMQVMKISEKAFVGKNPVHVAVFDREEALYYSMIYRDGKVGNALAKRFEVKGVTRDKLYDLTKGTAGSRVLFFSVHKAPEHALKVRIYLKPAPRLRTSEIDFDFGDLTIKGRSSVGNIVCRHPVARIARA